MAGYSITARRYCLASGSRGMVGASSDDTPPWWSLGPTLTKQETTMTRITRTLTAAGLALSLAIGAVGASATPARANNDDAARIIGGLIALYALGQVIQNSNGTTTVTRNLGHRPSGGWAQPNQHRPRQLVAPARCFIQGRDNNGVYRGYVRRCMQNNASRPAALPQNCLRRVETQRGPRMIYGGRCLANNGGVREAGFRN
jgi:hypothetical protein